MVKGIVVRALLASSSILSDDMSLLRLAASLTNSYFIHDLMSLISCFTIFRQQPSFYYMISLHVAGANLEIKYI